MQRILIMGPPGSGKSTLARKLGATLDLPVFHLDQLASNSEGMPQNTSEIRGDVERITERPFWIIDGNHPQTLACRMRAADVILYLDAPRWVTLPRLLWRNLINAGGIGSDIAAHRPERPRFTTLCSAWSWTPDRRRRSRALLRYFPGLIIVLANRHDRRRFTAKHLRRR